MTAIRLSPEIRKSVDTWAKKQTNKPSRSEAVRRLLEQALAAGGPATRTDQAAPAARAERMAGEQIDRMLADSDQSRAVKANRKKRLLKGPAEFRKK